MKKVMIVVIGVFIIIGSALSVMLIGASRVSRYYRDSDDHMRDVIVNYSNVYAGYDVSYLERIGSSADGGEALTVSLAPDNTRSLLTAVTREAVLYRLLPPPEGDSVTVTFDDGAVYTVIDGGTDKTGHDVAYIIYEYSGRRYYLSLTGYETFDRVLRCASPEGFGTKNWIVDGIPAE